MGPIHYELFIRRGGSHSWVLELATEDRGRATETAEEMIKDGRATAVRVCKEVLDEETREYKSVTILTKGDLSEPKKKKQPTSHASHCVSPADLYTAHARERIGRLLDGWLSREKATPFEVLHRPDLIEKLDAAGMDLQHAIQKIAIPEAQDTGVVVHEIIRHYQSLIETSINRVMKDHKAGLFPNLGKESFASVAERVCHNSERSYLMGAAVAGAMAAGKTWSEKVNILLDLADAAPQEPQARALAFQTIEAPLAEILGSRVGMADLLGPDLDIGGTVSAMTRLAAADTVDALAAIDPAVAKLMPPLEGPAARLANWLESGKFDDVRTALGQRVLRDLTKLRRLRPADAEEEIKLLRVLAMALTAAAGKRLPLEQVQEAFTERSQMLVRSDFVEAYLGENRSAVEEVEALIWLAENVTGAANKRAASRWISANIGALKFERDLRASPDSPAAKLLSLASMQKSVARVGFVPEELGPIVEKLGEVGGLIEADTRIVSLVAKAPAPAVHRLGLLVKLAAGETAPLGPVAERAKVEVMKMMKQPELRAELAASPQTLAKVAELMQTAA